MISHFNILIFGLLVATCAANNNTAVAQAVYRNSYLGKSPPEIVSQPEHWIGAKIPLTLKKLKGKVVWLHFNF